MAFGLEREVVEASWQTTTARKEASCRIFRTSCHDRASSASWRWRRGGRDALDGTRETLVALRVVVFETNLEFDGLNEVALLLAVGLGKELFDGASHT